jgi:hypothetical protein
MVSAVSICDGEGATPLLVACWKGTRETVAFLLGKKVSIVDCL